MLLSAMIPFVILMTCPILLRYTYLGVFSRQFHNGTHCESREKHVTVNLEGFSLYLLPIGRGEVQRRFSAGWPFPSRVDWIIGLDTSRDLGVCRPYFSFLHRVFLDVFKGISPFFSFVSFSCFGRCFDWPSYLIPKKVLIFFLLSTEEPLLGLGLENVTDDPAT